MTQRVGVVLVAPPLADQDEARAQKIGERMDDELLNTRIGRFRREVLNQTGVFKYLAQQHRAGVAGAAFRADLDRQAMVEGRHEERYRFTHGGALGTLQMGVNNLNLRHEQRHVSHFHAPR